ncbi:hypothetical protein N7450_011683 [Penicillium hetheringtonii]|uniref:Uncharacterized protein n=1 Tax=Penicillium hetheringtonii TaxID=911720 RepID=A0AAD6GN76_9EURO|nr:hypothetical protein N7450_011683 [Penicillium hetheringtonii]
MPSISPATLGTYGLTLRFHALVIGLTLCITPSLATLDTEACDVASPRLLTNISRLGNMPAARIIEILHPTWFYDSSVPQQLARKLTLLDVP